jgi:hypothetical protein
MDNRVLLRKNRLFIINLVQPFYEPPATFKKNLTPIFTTHAQSTCVLFPQRNNINPAFSGVRQARFLFITFDAALKTRSDGADVAGIDRILSASIQTCGYL